MRIAPKQTLTLIIPTILIPDWSQTNAPLIYYEGEVEANGEHSCEQNGDGQLNLCQMGLLYFAKRNETKRNEMDDHVLKWTYPVSQQSDSSVR